MPRWPACGSTTSRRTLLPYPKDDICAATATAPLNLVCRARERMADISPEERCHYASVNGGFIGQTAIWPAPRRVSPRFFAGPSIVRSSRLPEQQQASLSSEPRESFCWSQFRSCKPLGSLAVLNGCFNIKGFGFRIARSKLDLNYGRDYR